MGLDHSEYINNATERLVELLSTNTIRREEKEKYISSLTDSYTQNIFSPEKIEPYNVLFAKESLIYIDGLLSKYNAMQPLNAAQIDDVILLCERQKHNIAFLNAEKVDLPKIKILDVNRFCESIKRNYNNNDFLNRTLELDNLITDSIRKTISYNDEECNYIFSLLNEMDKNVSECKRRGINTDKLKHKDTNKTRNMIATCRQEASERLGLYNEIARVDYGIVNACNLWINDLGQIANIVAFCDNCALLVDNCKKRGWGVPALKCVNPIDVKNRYLLYDAMINTDRAISALIKDSSKEKHTLFLDNVNKQKSYILSCTQNNWALPGLIVKDLDGAIREHNRLISKNRRKTKATVVLAIIAISFFVILGSGLIVRSLYLRNNSKMPISTHDPAGHNYLEVVEELEAAGFKNVETRPVFTGIQAGGAVTEVTVAGSNSFVRNDYYSNQIEIIVYYYSEERVDLTPLLSGWQSKSVDTLNNALSGVGVNVKCEDITNDDPENNNKVVSIVINGEDYVSGDCFVPEGAEITIFYYDEVCRIEANAKDLIGKDYIEVRSELINLGFDNIVIKRKDDLITGILNKEYSIDSITINGVSDFKEGDIYPPDAEIVITVHTYKDKEYDDIDG